MTESWIDEVLAFWFEELTPEDWYKKSNALDDAIRNRFGDLYARLAEALPPEASATARGALAAVIVLDQFPRNMFRDTPAAFASDGAALAHSEFAIANGLNGGLTSDELAFLYMPFQHSEDSSVQARSVELFATIGNAETLDYAERHKAIIDRFGRFPHRNAILGRESTDEEIEFLKQPDSSF